VGERVAAVRSAARPERLDPITMRRTRRLLLTPALVAASLLLAAACGGDDARELAGYVREPEVRVDQVALPDVSQGGEPFTMRAQQDGLLLVYFGYTNCPDVCPTTLADVRAALRQLDASDAARVDLAMVTIDPARDTPVLTDYVQTFVEDAHALATEDDALLRDAANPFGASYSVTTNDAGQIEVSHSPQLHVVGDDGTLRLTWPFGVTADDLAADMEALLEGQTA
jgi:protein SCO1/2